MNEYFLRGAMVINDELCPLEGRVVVDNSGNVQGTLNQQHYRNNQKEISGIFAFPNGDTRIQLSTNRFNYALYAPKNNGDYVGVYEGNCTEQLHSDDEEHGFIGFEPDFCLKYRTFLEITKVVNRYSFSGSYLVDGSKLNIVGEISVDTNGYFEGEMLQGKNKQNPLGYIQGEILRIINLCTINLYKNPAQKIDAPMNFILTKYLGEGFSGNYSGHWNALPLVTITDVDGEKIEEEFEPDYEGNEPAELTLEEIIDEKKKIDCLLIN